MGFRSCLSYLVLLAFLGAAPVQAGWWDNLSDACARSWTRLRYGSFTPPALSKEDIALWRKAFAKAGDFPQISRNFLDEPLFWHIYGEIPETIRRALEDGPPEAPRFRLYASELAERAGVSSGTFLWNVHERWHDQTKGRIPFGIWAAQGMSAHALRLTAEPALVDSLRARAEALKEQRRASEFWMHAYEMEVPIASLGGNKYQVKIGNESYPGVVKAGWITLTVPRSRVTHPAWNPLSTGKLIDMGKSGVDVPDVFETLLGHDGLFYLQDANHRFAVSARDPVKITLPFPLKTQPFRNYLDLRGIAQPAASDILRLYRGEAGLWDIFPAHDRRRMQIEPK